MSDLWFGLTEHLLSAADKLWRFIVSIVPDPPEREGDDD